MKHLKLFFTSIFFLVLFFGFCQKKVLIIGIDGCRPDALLAANAPNLQALLKQSIYTLNAKTDPYTVSGPSWSSMLTGVNSTKHQVLNNKFTNNNLDKYPHFFSYLNDKLKLVSIAHWFPINKHLAKGHADKTIFRFDPGVAGKCIEYLNGRKSPDVIFLHFDAVDHAGHAHSYGPESYNYIRAIENTDKYVGEVLDALKIRKQAKPNEDWLIIASTDHGGENTGHGGGEDNPLIRNIFIFAQNDHYQPRKIEGGNVMDVSLTILDFLEVTLPEDINFDGVSLFKQY